MKRIIYIPVAAGVLVFGGIVLANSNSDDSTGTAPIASTEVQESVETSPVSRGQEELIGFERASAIALELAEGNVTDIELSEDDGRREYEVEIRNDEYEYDFDIDAFTGEVLEQDRERLKNSTAEVPKVTADSKQDMSSGSKESNKAAEVQISAEQASEIALKETGGGRVEEVELDSDDGLRYYEVEIDNGDTEYELEIDAASGKILKFEQDDNDDFDDDNDDDEDDNDD